MSDQELPDVVSVPSCWPIDAYNANKEDTMKMVSNIHKAKTLINSAHACGAQSVQGFCKNAFPEVRELLNGYKK